MEIGNRFGGQFIHLREKHIRSSRGCLRVNKTDTTENNGDYEKEGWAHGENYESRDTFQHNAFNY